VVDNSHAPFSLSKIIRNIKLPRSIYFPTIWSEIFGNSNRALTHNSRNYFPSLTAFLKIRDKSENIRKKNELSVTPSSDRISKSIKQRKVELIIIIIPCWITYISFGGVVDIS
jgi:hypothetical protein